MDSSKQIFHLLEVDLTTPDNKSRRYLYAGVAGKDCKLRLCRVRNIYDWKSEVSNASEMLVTGRRTHSNKSDGNIRLPMHHGSAI